MAWICVTVLQRCSGFLTECKKLGAQEQRGVGQQKGRKQRQDGEGGGGGLLGSIESLCKGKGRMAGPYAQ